MTTQSTRGYGPVVQEHFHRPRNVGFFDEAQADVATAEVGSRQEGGVIRLQLRVDGSGIIKDSCFKAYGCGATIAAASWVSEWVKGKSLPQARSLTSTELVQALALPPVKTHCALLAEDAVKAAVDHYMQRESS
ncbi:MAG TPA: iron-sulfur cluster assembly scaffold protein [Burkholderiaceae bacterium]|nr:iron-sulfur cluster assembly scaffold protein [Burkholderiaceae bacterium]